MQTIDSVVLLHDGPRLWLAQGADELLRAFRRPLPEDFSFDEGGPDWESVFRFLPTEIYELVRETRPIALVPNGSGGRPARIFSFDTSLPAELPAPDGPLGHVSEARLGRATDYAWEGQIEDPETLLALFAVAHARIKDGGRERG